MELILATANGQEERTIFDDFDIEVSLSPDVESTFQISVATSAWDRSFLFDERVYVPDTEYGGIIKDIEANANADEIYVRGYTWRGYLAHRIISPPSGADYYIVSGELNEVIRTVVGSTFGDIFRVSEEDTGVSVNNYQFARYVDMNAGLSAMLATKGYRLDITYVQTDLSGYVMLSAQPADTYQDDVELSQDLMLAFSSEDNRMGINHLVCLGTGELRDRVVQHLYADRNGKISETKTISGIDEIVGVYEDTSADAEALVSSATDRFKEMINKKSFQANFNNTDDLIMTLNLGDIITGRDYITGSTERKPIARKIINRSNGIIKISYRIEGELL